MKKPDWKAVTKQITSIHGRFLPELASPAGYAALISAYGLNVPVPLTLSAIGTKHKHYIKDGWQILTPRHFPAETLAGHLVFALKHEGLDLTVLKAVFRACGAAAIEKIVTETPTGNYARRVWFLYEWLTSENLKLPAATSGAYVPIVDAKRQYEVKGITSRRHRIRNNLPGIPAFCPMVFKTDSLRAFENRNLPELAEKLMAAVPAGRLSRAAAYLLLKDSRSSFEIEGEHPPHQRIERWGNAISNAGRNPIDLPELLRLQKIIIEDNRFVKLGLRKEGGFVGEHDRDTRMPIPVHISARAADLPQLIEGLISVANDNTARELNPVIAAAALAFGFVYIHPFSDGNGRLHRYLIQHILAARRFTPPGMVLPIASAILDKIDDYRKALESYSVRLLPAIRWKPDSDGNVEVLNDTSDFYRYFDATPHAEFLFRCVARAIEIEMPAETHFLKIHDEFRAEVNAVCPMPGATINLLFKFLKQNDGKLSRRAREKEFAALTEQEMERIESIYANLPASSADPEL